MKTDLGLGLELKSLVLKKTGYNALMVPHTLLNSTLLPAFALGAIGSDGHVDLGGRLIPSSEIRLTTEVTLNVLSRRGGGLVFSKQYTVELTDKMVSDSSLYQGIFVGAGDGQDLGRKMAPRIIADVFGMMTRDPELLYLPRYARAVWLGRIMQDERVAPAFKARIFDRVAGRVNVPEWSAEEMKILKSELSTLPDKVLYTYSLGAGDSELAPGGGFLELYTVEPAWAEEAAGRLRLFELVCQTVFSALDRLGQKKLQSPLTPDEKDLENKFLDLLGRWGGSYTANRLFRKTIQSPGAGLAVRTHLFRLLTNGGGAIDNQEFLNQELEAKMTAIREGTADETARDRAGLCASERQHGRDPQQ